MSSSRPFGSIIGLRPEYASRYRVLHRHVFPGVLDRIARSHIRNYSIFLHDNVLFSQLEYVGEDYDADMAAMASDETTREWWTLTDPMQVPLQERAPGDWWARLPVVYAAERPAGLVRETTRRAMVAPAPSRLPDDPGRVPASMFEPGIEKLRIFRSRDRLYVYLESSAGPISAVAAALADALALAAVPVEIEEVFHTDGIVLRGWALAGEGSALPAPWYRVPRPPAHSARRTARSHDHGATDRELHSVPHRPGRRVARSAVHGRSEDPAARRGLTPGSSDR